jgi:hypothetical protein
MQMSVDQQAFAWITIEPGPGAIKHAR